MNNIRDTIDYLEESKCDQRQGEDYQERHNEVLDIAIKALEKQVPKDVQKKVVGWKIDCFCPSCTLEVFGRPSYCTVCGQYLKWN